MAFLYSAIELNLGEQQYKVIEGNRNENNDEPHFSLPQRYST